MWYGDYTVESTAGRYMEITVLSYGDHTVESTATSNEVSTAGSERDWRTGSPGETPVTPASAAENPPACYTHLVESTQILNNKPQLTMSVLL